MKKKKVCKNCKAFVTGANCDVCKGNSFSENWKGRIYIFNSEKSNIAEKIGVKKNAEYAIKVK